MQEWTQQIFRELVWWMTKIARPCNTDFYCFHRTARSFFYLTSKEKHESTSKAWFLFHNLFHFTAGGIWYSNEALACLEQKHEVMNHFFFLFFLKNNNPIFAHGETPGLGGGLPPCQTFHVSSLRWWWCWWWCQSHSRHCHIFLHSWSFSPSRDGTELHNTMLWLVSADNKEH